MPGSVPCRRRAREKAKDGKEKTKEEESHPNEVRVDERKVDWKRRNAIMERPNANDVDGNPGNERWRKRKRWKGSMLSVRTIWAPNQGLPNMACERSRRGREI